MLPELKNIQDYEIKETLYTGRHFNILCVNKEKLQEKLVLKTANSNSHNDWAKAKLANEFELGRQFNHKNILTYHSYVEDGKYPYLIKEHFKSVRLCDFIPSGGLSIMKFLKIAIQIANALAEVHAKQIVYQLVNPSKILVDSTTLNVKLADFAYATNAYYSHIDLHDLKASMAYISPEQTGRTNRFVDYRSDLYALGISCYEMLTGTLPFAADDLLETVHCHLAIEPKPLHKIKASVPVVLSAMVSKLLAKNPEDRYQSAEGIQYDFECLFHKIQSESHDLNFELGTKDYNRYFKIPQKLFGREKEYELLKAQLRKVCEGDTVITMISGNSGIGKSAIVNELQKDIRIQKAYFATGKYEHLKRNMAYSVVTSAFSMLIRQILSESDERIQQWREKFSVALGRNAQVIIDLVPELELIIGKQPEVETLGSNENQNRFNMVFQNFVTVFSLLDHPLVIFLDDLQWIDLASLKLLTLLTSQHLTKSFFLIGAYRSNEVDQYHPAITTLEEIEHAGVDVQYIHLEPLPENSINQMVAETVNQSPEKTKELAALIAQKTNGNPFFIRTFIHNLYDHNFIFYKHKGSWEWDLKKIVEAKPTDNVTDLMVDKMNDLTVDCRKVLTYGALIGIEFDRSILSVISGYTEAELDNNLQQGLETGMLVKSDKGYRFIHDKVQEAAYSFITSEQKTYEHLKTGRLMLQHFSEQNLDDHLFSIVEHLNYGVEGISDKEEKGQLLALNLRVASKAKRSAAFKNAAYYYDFASKLLPEDSWEVNYEQSLKLYTEWAEVEHIAGNVEITNNLFQLILEKARTILDQTPIYRMLIVSCEYTAKYREAVDKAIEVVNSLGIHFPHPDDLNEKQKAAQEKRLLANLSKHKIDALIHLPEVEDLYKKEAIGLLINVIIPFWNAFDEQLEYLCSEIVNLTIEYGLSAESSLGYSMLGCVLATKSDTVDTGYQLAELAIKITERFKDNFNETAVKYLFYNHVYYWKQALRWRTDYLIEAMHAGLDNGNTQWAGYCVTNFCTRDLIVGTKLSEAKQHFDKYDGLLNNLGSESNLEFFNIPQQAVHNLMGKVENSLLLKGEAFDEERSMPILYQVGRLSAIGLVFTYKLLVLAVFGAYKEALQIVQTKNWEEYIRANAGMFQPYLGICLSGIVMMQNYEEVSGEEQATFLKKAEGLLAELATYAAINPQNFTFLQYLLQAEINRVKQNHNEAIHFYDLAIAAASEHHYLHFAALANELAAQYWFARNKDRIAADYLQEAYNFYTQWECSPKTKMLEEQHPGLFEDEKLQALEKQPFDAYKSIDIFSIQKATQAISSEVVLEKLIAKLVQIIIENAGAQKGYIILKQDLDLTIVAGFNSKNNLPAFFEPENLSQTSLLAENIVRYVIRTGENVLLENAISDGQFVHDAYIRENKSKSVLVMPIRYKSTILGALFLENNLSSHIFSKQTEELLNILLTQTGISLENANLFRQRNEVLRELTEEQEFINTAINTMPDTLFVFDVHTGKALKWNKAFNILSGYSDEEIKKAKAPDDFFNEEDNAKAVKSIQSMFETGISSSELQLVTKDKGSIPMEYTSGLMRDEFGQAKNIISIGRDVTQRNKMMQELKQKTEELEHHKNNLEELVHHRTKDLKEANEEIGATNDELLSVNEELYEKNEELNQTLKQLKETQAQLFQAEKMASLGVLTAGVAHEINNPLNYIMGAYLGLLQNFEEKSFAANEEEVATLIDALKEGVDRASAIVKGLSQFSRQSQSLVEDCDLHAIINNALTMLHNQLKHHITVQKEFAAEDLVIKGNEGTLHQVFVNILINAVHAIEKEGSISIKTASKESEVHIVISDNGCGIPPEVLDKIMDPFFTTKEPGKGTGLGLSITYNIIQEHKGDLLFDSEPGKGTRVTIVLPKDHSLMR